MEFDFTEANKVLFPTQDMKDFEEIFKNFTSPNGQKLIRKLGESYYYNKKISDLCKKLRGKRTSKGKIVQIEGTKDLFYRLDKLADYLKAEKHEEAEKDKKIFIENLSKAYNSWLNSENIFEAIDAKYAEYLSKSKEILSSYSDKLSNIDKFPNINKFFLECRDFVENLNNLYDKAENKEKKDKSIWQKYKEKQSYEGLTLSEAVPKLSKETEKAFEMFRGKLKSFNSSHISDLPKDKLLIICNFLEKLSYYLEFYISRKLSRKGNAILKVLKEKEQTRAKKAADELANTSRILQKKINDSIKKIR